jgi:hypothetical protein
LVFFMSTSSIVWAQENMCIVPTGTEEVNELASSLTVYASSDEISPTQPVSLRAAWGCYPFQYSWTVQGTGYSLSKISTSGDLDYTILSVVGGTCGENQDYAPYVTISVTDGCEGEDSVVIRNTGGTWIFDDICFDVGGCLHWGVCKSTSTCVSASEMIVIEDGIRKAYIAGSWPCCTPSNCTAEWLCIRGSSWCGDPFQCYQEAFGSSICNFGGEEGPYCAVSQINRAHWGCQ